MKSKILFWFSNLLLGLILGFILGISLIQATEIQMLTMLISFLVSVFLQIIIHESGHAIGGACSGYQFLSFRILSWQFQRQPNGKSVITRQSVVGTLGQCLMIPPIFVNRGSFPYRRYAAGGIIANLIASLMALLFIRLNFYLLAPVVLVGLYFAGINWLPTTFSDGKALQLMRREPNLIWYYYVQLAVNAETAFGKTYAELPHNFFEPLPKSVPPNVLTDWYQLLQVGLAINQFNWEKAQTSLSILEQRDKLLVLPLRLDVEKRSLLVLMIQNSNDPKVNLLLSRVQKHRDFHQEYSLQAAIALFKAKDLNKARSTIKAGYKASQKIANLGERRMTFELLTWLDKHSE